MPFLLLLVLLLLASPASPAPAATPSAVDDADGALPWWAEQPRFTRRLLSRGQRLTADGWPAGDVVAKGEDGALRPWRSEQPRFTQRLLSGGQRLKVDDWPAGDVVAKGGDGALLPSWAEQPRFAQRLLRGGQRLKADGWPAGVVVAQGGGGHYQNITAALVAAPKGKGRYVIRIGNGTYFERLNITRRNVVLIGDGVGKTIITGNLSNLTGTTPLLTATVTALGHGFVAMNLTIQNTAGPEGHQALALRINSNRSIVYGCSLEGHQDTLLAENNLQLFVDTDISGTVDFVYGNAKAVFVGCRLLARRPRESGAHNVITAQGRDSPHHDSAFVFIKCTVTGMPGENLTGVDTFLGRPWKNHSRVIFISTFMDDIVNATGWVPWNRHEVVEQTTRTVAYLEYKNWGPKANISQRVKWAGFRVMSAAEAQTYTFDRFLAGKQWLSSAPIHFNDTVPI